MLDDLRNSVNTEFPDVPLEEENTISRSSGKNSGPFLGMTAPQRFIIACFLFLMVAIIGAFVLILFQKVFPPI
ncbi:MAG: hypothetical protein KBF64_03635 [Anaerolineaceae bacterium]|jgi:hypothetical protein|nr:hypothetical protein [Anaerolineaceae bacterium]